MATLDENWHPTTVVAIGLNARAARWGTTPTVPYPERHFDRSGQLSYTGSMRLIERCL